MAKKKKKTMLINYICKVEVFMWFYIVVKCTCYKAFDALEPCGRSGILLRWPTNMCHIGQGDLTEQRNFCVDVDTSVTRRTKARVMPVNANTRNKQSTYGIELMC